MSALVPTPACSSHVLRNATFAQNKGDYRNYECKINIENYMKRWFNDRKGGKLFFFFEVGGKGGMNFWVPSV